jgi:thioredoxin reductase (NADPH)
MAVHQRARRDEGLATRLRREGQWLFVGTYDGTEILTRAIIVAAGLGAFGPNRPPLAGIESLEGTSVHYWVTDPEAFRDKHVVIAGGGDSAMLDQAFGVTRTSRLGCQIVMTPDLDGLRVRIPIRAGS